MTVTYAVAGRASGKYRNPSRARVAYLKECIGPDLADCMDMVVGLMESEAVSWSARSKVTSLRQWMGPVYWPYLLNVVNNATLSALKHRHVDRGTEVRRGRDALALVYEWREERRRWGLD